MRKMKNMLILAVMIFSLWITTGLSLSAEETKPTSGNPDNRLEEILQRGETDRCDVAGFCAAGVY